MTPSPTPSEGDAMLDVRSMSQSVRDGRCLELWFARNVTDTDRAQLLEAINAWNIRAAAQAVNAGSIAGACTMTDEQIAAQSSGVWEKIEALAHLYDLKAVNSIFAERTLIYATVANDIRALSPDTPREGEK